MLIVPFASQHRNISFLWSGAGWAAGSFYKHPAPTELYADRLDAGLRCLFQCPLEIT